MTAMPPALQASLHLASLPARVRAEVDLLAAAVERVLSSPCRMTAYDAVAAWVRAESGRKCTAARLRSLTGKYLRSGRDPLALIDKRKLVHDDRKLPAAFLEEVKRRFQAQGRSAHEAWVQLINDWRRGVPMPGYLTNPPANPLTDFPLGWSYEHLAKKCKSSAFEKVAMRVGLGRAKAKHGPKLFTTRVGLWPMSHLMFDDVDHDNFIHLLTDRQLCRVSQLGCLDVLSGCYFKHGMKPQLQRLDPVKDKLVTSRLKEESMRFLLASVLFEHGYSARGTSLVVERGTATIREDIIALLHDRTGGVVTVDKGGWTGKEQAVAGMFLGKGGGNPRHKSILESLHNLIHNKLAALPGQTGPDVERRPEQLDGMLRESADLLKLAKVLPEYITRQLEFPTIEYHSQFEPFVWAAMDAMNRRTWHEMEGWEKCGFTTTEYRLHAQSNEWLGEQAYLDLPAGARAALAEIAQVNPACRRPRRLSPHEVFTLGQRDITPAPVALIAEILYADLAVERKCRNSYFEFEDRMIDPDTLRFEARVRTLDGREHELPDDTYEVVVNPFRPAELWVYSGKRGQGGFLGLARRVEAVSRSDASAKGRELARLRTRYDELKAPLQARHAGIAREETRRVANNIAALEGPRGNPEFSAAAESLLGDCTPAAPAEPETETFDPTDLL